MFSGTRSFATIRNLCGSCFDIETCGGMQILAPFGEVTGEFHDWYLDVQKLSPYVSVLPVAERQSPVPVAPTAPVGVAASDLPAPTLPPQIDPSAVPPDKVEQPETRSKAEIARAGLVAQLEAFGVAVDPSWNIGRMKRELAQRMQ